MRPVLPSGRVTFLFTDVEGSTLLLERLGPERYGEVLEAHRDVIRRASEAHGGVAFGLEGDAVFVAFASAPDALRAAAAVQERLVGGPIAVRVGLHTGEPLVLDGDYVGIDVHRAARIAAAGHGGQVLLSLATAESAGENHVLTDLGEHRFKDLAAPERVFQLGKAVFPPIRSLYRVRLPVPATPFLGRADEVAALAGLLAGGEARLVTLTGPGGTGKTRLALQAAGDAFDAFPDGVTWVALASLRDPVLVLPTVAAALDVAEQPGGRLEEALAAALGGKRCLLLLDNLEQLLPAASAAISALRDIDGPTLLVTSRERLRVAGERAWPVPALREPDAVALFVARARALDPSFEPSEAVAELCARLDALPLAIELAAARTALFTPEQTLVRLAQRLDLLRGDRDADPRQQTLRAAIEWSFELLSDQEQALFAALSVFSGGCSYEAAEAVAGADALVLESLLDKSLLRRRDTSSGARYAMLETIRQFAADRLAASGRVADVAERHAVFYAAFALEADGRLRGSGMNEAINDVRDAHDNLRAALAHDLEADPVRALRVGSALQRFWYVAGHSREGYGVLRAALDAGVAPPDEVRARALRAAGTLCESHGDYETAASLLEESVELWRGLDTGRELAVALNNLGAVRIWLHDRDAAQACFAESLELKRALGDVLGTATTMSNLANLVQKGGDLAEARRLQEDALGLLRQVGDPVSVANSLQSLAEIALLEDDPARARALATEAIALAESSDDPLGAAEQRIVLARAGLVAGELDTARLLLHEAVELCTAHGHVIGLALAFEAVADLAAADGADGAALRLLAAADATRESLGSPPWSSDRVWHERLLGAVEERHGAADVREEFDAGRRLSRDAAVALALDVLGAATDAGAPRGTGVRSAG